MCPASTPGRRQESAAEEGSLRGSITARAATDAPCSVLHWWTTQHHQRVLTGVAGNRAELVQELALLASAGVHVARRQGSRQIVPTGLFAPPPGARWGPAAGGGVVRTPNW